MRRSVSSLLAVAVVASLFVPLLAAQPAARAACCLRNGQHHCMQSAGADGFQAQPSPCPYRHHFALFSAPVALLRATSAVDLVFARQLMPVPQAGGILSLDSYSVPQRGPPLA